MTYHKTLERLLTQWQEEKELRTSLEKWADWIRRNHWDLKPKPVRTKLDFVPRYKAGEFGNASPTWNTINDFVQSGYVGPIHFRNKVPQGKTWYNVPSHCAKNWFENLVEQGVDPSLIYFSAMAPHQHNVLQGEVWHSTDYLTLTYSTAHNLPMRDALRLDLNHAYGLKAVALLRWALCPNSWEWLNQLLDNYDGHVIEFSSFGVTWGTVPGFNTVFWEVRSY